MLEQEVGTLPTNDWLPDSLPSSHPAATPQSLSLVQQETLPKPTSNKYSLGSYGEIFTHESWAKVKLGETLSCLLLNLP